MEQVCHTTTEFIPVTITGSISEHLQSNSNELGQLSESHDHFASHLNASGGCGKALESFVGLWQGIAVIEGVPQVQHTGDDDEAQRVLGEVLHTT
jgi:hypothetical protein